MNLYQHLLLLSTLAACVYMVIITSDRETPAHYIATVIACGIIGGYAVVGFVLAFVFLGSL